MFLVPILLASFVSFLLRHEAGALAAPLFGPWAGYILGHADCTFAAVIPHRSYSLLISGVVICVVRLRAEEEVERDSWSLMLLLWSCLWLVSGVLSVLNTTS
jgi:hypothetical protein